MNKRTPLIDQNGEVRELTAADLKRFRPAHEALPQGLQKTLGIRARGPQKKPTKVSTTIRLDEAALARWRASGKGWQTRAAQVLAKHAPRRSVVA